MEISVNNQYVIVPENSSILEILSSLAAVSQTGLAIAINDQIISRLDWPLTFPLATDQITLIKATQGG